MNEKKSPEIWWNINWIDWVTKKKKISSICWNDDTFRWFDLFGAQWCLHTHARTRTHWNYQDQLFWNQLPNGCNRIQWKYFDSTWNRTRFNKKFPKNWQKSRREKNLVFILISIIIVRKSIHAIDIANFDGDMEKIRNVLINVMSCNRTRMMSTPHPML